MKTLTMYLAGAIRDSHPDDLEWREQFARKFNTDIQIGTLSLLSPLAGKRLHRGHWGSHGVPCDTAYIVNSDFWSVDHADIIVFNLLALAEQYPCIGTLLEFGRSTSRSILRYSILPDHYTGHENEQFQHRVHPFLKAQSVAIFPTVDACATYLWHSLPSLAGVNAHSTQSLEETATAQADTILRTLPNKGFFKA